MRAKWFGHNVRFVMEMRRGHESILSYAESKIRPLFAVVFTRFFQHSVMFEGEGGVERTFERQFHPLWGDFKDQLASLYSKGEDSAEEAEREELRKIMKDALAVCGMCV